MYLANMSSQIKSILNPLKFRLWSLTNLPSVWFWGIRLSSLSSESSKCTIHFRWSNKNPFKSIYFAALGGAAELSTGAAAIYAIEQTGSKFSMLVTDFQATFSKKAVGKITFECTDGPLFTKQLESLKKSETTTIKAKSIGTDQSNDVVCTVMITWSFKKK